ncbi:Uncharacterised protein [Bordetella pertussis]|nr:Uncharacterised protein [Bordetella pertussis]CFW02789.1 Uncharacterised protein [Bordetella pertussis]CFW44023.1 Uncharacterised protein [Bordetella pertussis]CPH76209.1 Uncharacterised protein [Bordetella pertussis]CPK92904.1 Uncharacterised protein [Bordetella pertussis]
MDWKFQVAGDKPARLSRAVRLTGRGVLKYSMADTVRTTDRLSTSPPMWPWPPAWITPSLSRWRCSSLRAPAFR